MNRGHGLFIVIAVAAALSGCGSLGRKPPPSPAPVAVPAPSPAPIPAPPVRPPPQPPPPAKSCVPKSLSPPPGYPDTDAALRNAGGAADRYQLLAAGRILRKQRLEELERAILGCR